MSEIVETKEQLETKRRIFNDLLQNHVMEITFKKKNGEERKMLCTLMEKHLPPAKIVEDTKPKVERKKSETAIAVWDMEAEDWRSFAIDSVQTFAFAPK